MPIKKNIIILSFLFILFIIPAFTLAESRNDNILIKFSSNKDQNQVSREYGISARDIKKIEPINVFKIKRLSWDKTIKAYWNKFITGKIEYIEADQEFKISTIPNDPLYSSQWALPKISADSGWNSTTGSDSVIIAIVDTGIKGTHEDLTGKVVEGYDFIHDNIIAANSDSDDEGHGTLVSGIASADTDNGLGIAGVDWQARLMPVKVLDSTGHGISSDIAEGIIYAADHGAKVLNFSFGGEHSSKVMEDAIDYAHDTKGCVIIAASGNEDGPIAEPARYAKVMAVGATDQNDLRCTPASCGFGSNYGPELDLTAPGYRIYSTTDAGGYTSIYSGTSLSAPHASGLAALIWSLTNSYTNTQIEELLKNNADKVAGMGGENFTDYYGYGRINVNQSLKSYHYQWISQNANPTLTYNGAYNFQLTIKNTGTATWTKDVVRLGTSNPLDRTPVFAQSGGNPSGWISNNRVELPVDEVLPGEETTFSFWLTVPEGMNPNVYSEYFRLVADGVSWLEDYGINWSVIVRAPYGAAWISQNSYPILGHGQTYQFEVIMQNNGYNAWSADVVRLGTDRPQDRIPIFTRGDGWVSANRVGLIEPSVSSGQNGTFRFKYTVSNGISPGNYREYFRPVADGISWLNDWGIYWDMTVLSDSAAYSSSWNSQSNYPTLHGGESATLFIKFRNNGQATWTKDMIHLGTANPLDRIPIFTHGSGWVSANRVELKEDSVSPASLGTFEFVYTVPEGTSPGVYREYFRPVADGVQWMEDQGVYLDIAVE